MEKIALYFVLMLLMTVGTACSTPRDFSELARVDGVTMTYFGPGMTGMIGGALGNALGGSIKVSDARITGLRIIKADNHGAVKKTHTLAMAEVRALRAVPVMEVARGGSDRFTAVYATADSSTGNYNNVVVVAETHNHSVTVIMQGNFTKADVNALGDVSL